MRDGFTQCSLCSRVCYSSLVVKTKDGRDICSTCTPVYKEGQKVGAADERDRITAMIRCRTVGSETLREAATTSSIAQAKITTGDALLSTLESAEWRNGTDAEEPNNG